MRTCNLLAFRFGRFLLAIVAIALVPFNSSSQTTGPLDRQTPLALAPGAPAGSRIEDLASVNLFNGNLNFALPLATAGGRGGIEVPLALTIERHWQVQTRCFVTITGQTSCQKFVSSMWWGNQQVGYGPGIVQGRGADTYTSQSNGGSPLCSPNGGVVFTFTDPSGTEHELRDSLTSGSPNAGCSHSRGTNFVSVDGTSITFVSDSVINDDWANGPDPARPTGYLLFPNGTRYRVENGLVMWIRDRNGNKVSYVYEAYSNVSRVKTITDALGRIITVNYDVNDPTYGLCDQIVVPGFGTTTQVVSITKTSLSAALRYDQPQPQTYGQLFPEGTWLNAGTQFNPSIVSGVYLPNGQSYKFYYNTYGELARIQIPAGGAVDYDYLGGLTNEPNSGAIINSRFVYRRVVAKRVFTSASDLGSNTKVTTYSRPESWSSGTGNVNSVGFVSIENRAVDNSFLSYEKHYFHGAAAHSFITVNPYPAWNDGQEYQAEIFDADETTALWRSTKNWQQRAHVSWWSNYAAAMHLNPNDEPANDPRVVETTQVIEPSGANLVSKVSAINPQTQLVGFDRNNQTDSWQYDYGVGAPSNYPKTHVHTDYLAVNPANNISYADPVNGNSYTANDVHLRGVPRARQIYSINPTNGIETLVAQNETRYDEPAYPLLTYGTVTSWNDPGAARGNATTIRNWVDTSDSWLETHAEYDQCGSVVNAWDAKGNQSQIEYSSDYVYAYPTLTRTPVPDPSGQHGSTTALVSTGVFDFDTGLVTSTNDANNITTTFEYNDVLNRLTRAVHASGTPAQSQTSITYDDTNRTITTTSDQSVYNDNVLKAQTIYDGLGRTIESRQYEGGSNYIVAQTQYDALGRAFKTSHPFRPWNSETAVWTTSAFDALGRVVTITTPDSAVVTTSYSGNTVTVTDQTSKQRKSVSDGLGRLIQVYEDPAGLNYLTSYSYDTLDDLTTVSQGSQTRSFVYDSLKRLLSATNPESGIVGYSYDNNGNLLTKTDARGITTTLAYDALNRPTSKTYQNDPNSTPPVNYFYDSQTLPSGAPSFSRGPSIGRLLAVTSGTGSSVGDYYGYDAAGRSVLNIQQTGGVNYQISANYNLAGELTTETYPSGRTVTNGYDSAGRTISVTGSLGDGTQRTYSAGIIYSSLGGMTKEQFGTATPVYNKLFYNVRGQLSEIRESTSYTGPTDTTWDRGAIINNYSLQAGCVGASCSVTDNNGNLMRQDVYIPGSSVFTQFYGYDSLNRLQSVHEDGPPGPANWQQAYTYDQYGNRKMNSAATWGNGINSMQAAVDPNTTTNRMYAPGETDQNHSLINYDNAGNQTKDYYSDSGNGEGYDRTYDAENRMKSSTATYSSPASTQTSTYTYDGDGRRVKRNIGSTETWQVYGLGGELLAEYAPNASPAIPQKEYGYRNGQLLITATAPSALAANTSPVTKPEAVAAASPASGKESATAAQSFDLLASIKGLMLRLPGISTVSSASTEAISDTSTPLYGPSFPYAGSLNRSALPLMPQSGSAKIAFASNRDGSAQIYSMNTDGSGLSRLTNDAANDEVPNWSPNNSRIVFQSDRDNPFSGIGDIYVMNWDGSGQTRLTSDPADDSAPVWSPDGTRIAFQSARNGASYQVYVMNADGSGQVNISNSAANDNQPSWSPDGSKIAFASDRDQAGFSSVYVMNANGTNQTRLTTSGTGVLDQQPAWSPDGTKLTFTSTRDSIVQTWQETDDNGGIVTKSALQVNKEVYVMNADGSAQVRLTNTLENDDSASWSGDGTKIVFRSDRERDCCDPTEQVWLMNPDGTSQMDLSNNGLDEHCPSWQHVAANMPPTVSLTSPANGATFIAPANITLTANASDSDGSVTRVDFYQGVTLIGTATTSPYTITWNNVAAGSYSLTARATDNLGATTTSTAVTIAVNANAPPVVSITSPANGATFNAAANITVTANASDSDGTVSRVDFYQGATLIGTSTTSPYTVTWSNVAAGSYSLTARATDNLGATTTSTAVTITVNANVPPAVSISSPTTGAVFTAPANITVTANASDSDGSVSRVDFYQGATLIGTTTTSPYTINWNNVAAGSYSLTARATDNLGATTTSAPVNITVNAPPTVSITSPTNGASFTAPANITITANASDSDGSISRVDFYQGTTLIGTATTSPYTISWNNVVAGGYTITARATDNLGASTTSNPISITVGSPPTVSVTTPTNGTSFTATANVTITANASASNGSINRVEFYQGTTLIGTSTASPYTIGLEQRGRR